MTRVALAAALLLAGCAERALELPLGAADLGGADLAPADECAPAVLATDVRAGSPQAAVLLGNAYYARSDGALGYVGRDGGAFALVPGDFIGVARVTGKDAVVTAQGCGPGCWSLGLLGATPSSGGVTVTPLYQLTRRPTKLFGVDGGVLVLAYEIDGGEPHTDEITALPIGRPGSPVTRGGFYTQSLFALGDRVYLGGDAAELDWELSSLPRRIEPLLGRIDSFAAVPDAGPPTLALLGGLPEAWGIWTVPVTGGAPVSVVSGLPPSYDLRATADAWYVLDRYDGTPRPRVLRIDRETGAVTTALEGSAFIDWYQLEGRCLYAVTGQLGEDAPPLSLVRTPR